MRGASLEGFAGNVWFFGSEAVVAGLWRASLRKSCCLGPVVLGILDSEAPARYLRGASLVDFAGKWWFWGSEAVVAGMRRASLRKRMSRLVGWLV